MRNIPIYDRVMKLALSYIAGVLVGLWRVDGPWPTKLTLALLWPLGPLAFVVIVAILLAASLVAFPAVGAVVAASAVAAWWMLG